MQTIKYPRSVFFIIVNEFCERFSYYGMKSKPLMTYKLSDTLTSFLSRQPSCRCT